MAAAANGSSKNVDGVTKQVDRLLMLPAVQANLVRITLGWFNVNQLYAKQKDKSLLTPLNPTDATISGSHGVAAERHAAIGVAVRRRHLLARQRARSPIC